jgi:hypothetical protein
MRPPFRLERSPGRFLAKLHSPSVEGGDRDAILTRDRG